MKRNYKRLSTSEWWTRRRRYTINSLQSAPNFIKIHH